jgi:phospholipase/carboxylesterase
MEEILNGPSISKHDKPKKLIFMLHGYGDNAANFIHLAHPIDKDEWGVQYIALNGPGFIPDNFMGYQWFDLYPNGIYIAEAGPKELQQIQKEINKVIIRIVDTIKHYCSSLNLNLSDCILMGFSQGGIMTFEVANFLKEKLAGLVILSGRIIKEDSINNSVLQQTPIFISHGERDEVISIKSFHNSTDYLSTNKCNFESHILPLDEHNISPEAIILLQNFIKKIL